MKIYWREIMVENIKKSELDNNKIVYLMQTLSMDLQLKAYKNLEIDSKRKTFFNKKLKSKTKLDT